MSDEQAPAAPNPAAPVALIAAGVIAVETLILTVAFVLIGPVVLLLGAMAEFFLWGAAGTQSKATVLVVGAIAFVSIPLISLMLVVGRLGGASL